MRWVADALAILRVDGGAFAWPRVVAQGARCHVVPHLTDILSYLRDRWRIEIPATVFTQLANISVSSVDRRA